MIINSSNGWDSLEEIIVGRADFANVPPAPTLTLVFNLPKSTIP